MQVSSFFFLADYVAALWDLASCAQWDNSTVTAGCHPRCSTQGAHSVLQRSQPVWGVTETRGRWQSARLRPLLDWIVVFGVHRTQVQWTRKRQVKSTVNYSEREKAPLKVKITFWLLLFRVASFYRSAEKILRGGIFRGKKHPAAAFMQLLQHHHKYETVELKCHRNGNRRTARTLNPISIFLNAHLWFRDSSSPFLNHSVYNVKERSQKKSLGSTWCSRAPKRDSTEQIQNDSLNLTVQEPSSGLWPRTSQRWGHSKTCIRGLSFKMNTLTPSSLEKSGAYVETESRLLPLMRSWGDICKLEWRLQSPTFLLSAILAHLAKSQGCYRVN